MTIVFKGAMKPKNASCSWNTSLTFWRFAGGVCPGTLTIYTGGIDANYKLGISGAWITGTVGDHCAGTDPYLSIPGGTFGQVDIDVWKALADGLWTSSVVFNVKQHYAAAGGGTRAGSIVASPNGVTPSAQLLFPTINDINPGNVCPTTNVATVTVNDDGTFTLA